MIKDIRHRINVDQRGKITSGKKSEKGYPQSLDHFNIEPFPELMKAYGTKPSKLVLYFPTDNIEDFFDCNYVLYGGNNAKIRQCDGEECLHRIDETIEGKSYAQGEISECLCKNLPEGHKKRCSYSMYLKAWIVDPKLGKVNNPICYMFYTGSKNSGDNIYTELEKIKALNMGVLRGVPFGISVKMVGGKEDAKKKFPIWQLQAIGMLDQIRERTAMMLEMPKNPAKQIEGKKEEPNYQEPDPENPLGLE